MGASFLQTSFLGGVWSPAMQGQMTTPTYKDALNRAENYYYREEGPVTRRPGTKLLGPTRSGAPARLIAFDFAVSEPYQMEFTDGFLRFYLNQTILTEPAQVITSISNTSPAVVSTAAAHGYTTGDTVLFAFNAIPVLAPQLLNRQFVITVLDSLTFSLADALTGDPVDGSVFSYSIGTVDDFVSKVFELTTPYTDGEWSDLRIVTNTKNVVLLHPDFAPLVLSGNQQTFELNPLDFYDGPYLDINTLIGTNLTPSAVTGSITLTANRTLGINNGAGFETTDVGRLVRFQGGPAVWAGGTTYSLGQVVTGSDAVTYQSNIDGNIGNDPTTDGGVNWTVNGVGVIWTWMKITAWTSATVVSADILGPDLPNTLFSSTWRLGFFSDTTGWPKVGVYHESRIWFTGASSNRVDGSVAGNLDVNTYRALDPGTLNFAPTATDGTVGDFNGVQATANADEANIFNWLVSDDSGLIAGSQAGEWLVRASTLDDPLTPTSIQMRRFSKYGVAPIEPVRANRELIFVQRQLRRLLELGYYPYGEVAGYYAPNMSKFAEHLTAPGIAEIRWQPDNVPVLWMRMRDNTLRGITYRHSPAAQYGGVGDTFIGWHGPHALGTQREVESISSGPAIFFNGLSFGLFMVTNQTDVEADDFNHRYVEVLTPDFDDSMSNGQAWYVDAGLNPPYAEIYYVSTVATGVRFWGLSLLAGYSVSVMTVNRDLGDYVVDADGHIDVPFGAVPDFTLDYITSQSSSNWGFLGVKIFSRTETTTMPPIAADTLLAYIGPDTTHVVGANVSRAHEDASFVYEFQLNHIRGGMRKLNQGDGAEVLQRDQEDIIGAPTPLGAWSAVTTYASGDVVTGSDTELYASNTNGNFNHDPVTDAGVHWDFRPATAYFSTETSYLHPDGHIYTQTGSSNSSPMLKISTSALVLAASYGSNGSSLAGSTTGRLQHAFNAMAGASLDGGTKNRLFFMGITSATTQQLTMISTDSTMNWLQNADLDEPFASLCDGQNTGDLATVFALGFPNIWPTLWAIGTTYFIDATVFGSDGNVYLSLSNSNVGNDPTTSPAFWAIQRPAVGLHEITVQSGINSGETFSVRTVKKFGPLQIASDWKTIANVIGPAFDKSDNSVIFLVETLDVGVTSNSYLVKVTTGGDIVMRLAMPEVPITNYTNQVQFAQSDIQGFIAFIRAGVLDHNAFVIDLKNHSITTQALNTGFTGFTGQRYDAGSGSVLFNGQYVTGGTGPTMSYTGVYLPLNADQMQGWGRLYLGIDSYSNTDTTYTDPFLVGKTYTSFGQLLRPDYGADLGPRNGPSFGKKRRLHQAALSLYRSRQLSIGTDPNNLLPLELTANENGGDSLVNQPFLFSGIAWQTINDDYSFTGQLAWQQTRPFPGMIQAIQGFAEESDK